MIEGVEKQERYLWVDYARIVAIWGTILVHAAVPATLSFGDRPLSAWWAGNVAFVLGKVATPFFFMLSGFLLLPKEESLIDLWKKRILRMVLPLLAWSIFYMLIRGYHPADTWAFVRDVVGLAIHPAEYHLWFMYALLGLYVVLPILRLLVKHADAQLLYYYIAVWVLAVGIIPWLARFSMQSSYVDLLVVSGYAGYMVLGYVLGTMQITRKVILFAVLAILTGFTFTVVVTYLRTVANNGMLESTLYERLYPNIVLYVGGMWVLLRAAIERLPVFSHERVVGLVRVLGRATFGVYLVHAFVITVLGEGWLGFKLNGLFVHPVVGIPLMAVTVYVLSLGITLILQRIPLIRQLV